MHQGQRTEIYIETVHQKTIYNEVLKMEELELFLAGHPDIEKAAVLVGECGPERIEEMFRYTNLKECCVICPWPRRDIETLAERIQNDAARGLFVAPQILTFVPYYDFRGMEGQWAF